MNNIFKKEKKEVIVLDDNYTLNHDGYSGVVLTFSEMREKEKKTGEKEQYLYEEPRYFATVGQALKRYVELSQNSAKSIEEIIEKTDKILAVAEDFRKNFKNW